ncbi:MAG: dienelactone hydrolase family protein [Candidatus Eremiobacteraeota bacterium]|nr:dienelactone hydrolase family protein [Candidatus Eremiobacteraeota bacterium]
MRPLEESFTDPVDATKAEFSRRGFVSLGAGAALAAGNAAAASAQTDGLGKPHPPLVAEDDPAIVVSRPRLTPAAGGAIGAYAATPRTVKSTTPGVVVIMHAWGVDAQIRDTVRRYAKAGFIAIAPNLFERLNAPSGDGVNDFDVFRPYLSKLFTQGFVPTDVLAAHGWIPAQARDAAIGITGFCMGGGIVLQSIIDSKGFAAASMFYGNVLPGADPNAARTPATFDFASRITTPLMGSFGARDTSIKPDDVRAMFARLSAPHDVKIYDEAGHAFFDDTRPSYVPSAAADAWTRTLTWFHKYLG